MFEPLAKAIGSGLGKPLGGATGGDSVVPPDTLWIWQDGDQHTWQDGSDATWDLDPVVALPILWDDGAGIDWEDAAPVEWEI